MNHLNSPLVLVDVPLDLDSQAGADLLTTEVYMDSFEQRFKAFQEREERGELVVNLVVALVLWAVGGLVVWWML